MRNIIVFVIFVIDQSKLSDYSIVNGAKIHLVVRKDNETNLSRELKAVGKNFVSDVDQFSLVFNQVRYS